MEFKIMTWNRNLKIFSDQFKSDFEESPDSKYKIII